MEPPPRILATPAAVALIAKLEGIHGPLMFHQSGGCCDGSAPMCYPAGEFRVGGQDILLGRIANDVPVWIGAAQFAYWRHNQVTIDVVPGRGAGFSLEGRRACASSCEAAFSPTRKRTRSKRPANRSGAHESLLPPTPDDAAPAGWHKHAYGEGT